MTKEMFLEQLEKELKRRGIADGADILEEYEQHFAFRLADGFSQEEIAAKLGNPAELAAQFESASKDDGNIRGRAGGRKGLVMTGLCFADLFTGLFFLLLYAWGICMAALVLGCVVLAVCLFLGIGFQPVIPYLPYGCGVVYGLASTALAALTAVGCIYFFAFVRQLMRAYGRWHHNALAAASGGAVLPALAAHPQFPAKKRRTLRAVALVSLAALVVCAILAILISMLSAQALEYWHAWGWFGYGA